MGLEGYLAHHTAPDEQIAGWIEQFHQDGFLFLPNVLPPRLTANLRADLDIALSDRQDNDGARMELHCRIFEHSNANLSLFELEPMITFAERLIATDIHVVCNDAYRTPIGKGVTTWHQDDAPHYLVTSGAPPTNVRLPVLHFTANYYLTDVPTVEHGPTQIIPGSHLLGAAPPPQMEGTPWEDKIVSCCGPAGSVVLFNSQVWHRGAPNLSDQVRYMTRVGYGRRSISHAFYPFMNYQMPVHCYEHASPRLKRLLGFPSSGACR